MKFIYPTLFIFILGVLFFSCENDAKTVKLKSVQTKSFSVDTSGFHFEFKSINREDYTNYFHNAWDFTTPSMDSISLEKLKIRDSDAVQVKDSELIIKCKKKKRWVFLNSQRYHSPISDYVYKGKFQDYAIIESGSSIHLVNLTTCEHLFAFCSFAFSPDKKLVISYKASNSQFYPLFFDLFSYGNGMFKKLTAIPQENFQTQDCKWVDNNSFIMKAVLRNLVDSTFKNPDTAYFKVRISGNIF